MHYVQVQVRILCTYIYIYSRSVALFYLPIIAECFHELSHSRGHKCAFNLQFLIGNERYMQLSRYFGFGWIQYVHVLVRVLSSYIYSRSWLCFTILTVIAECFHEHSHSRGLKGVFNLLFLVENERWLSRYFGQLVDLAQASKSLNVGIEMKLR